jgi:hypothetical protein
MRFFKILHFLSLDVVLGALSLHGMIFHALLHEWPRWEYTALLGISVFLIYGMDRQIDNRLANAGDDLHRFHAHFQKPILGFMVALGILNAILLVRVDSNLLVLGMSLLTILFGYWFAWIKGLFEKYWGTKELLTSLIYSLGILLPTSLYAVFPFLLGLSLFLLVLLNLWIFTWISTGGKRYYITLLIYVSLVSLLLLGISGIDLFVIGIMLMIWGIHVGIYYFRAQMHMRLWAEWAFTSPLIYILCNL